MHFVKIMTKNTVANQKLHVQLRHHLLKHGKRLQTHIRKHHKKYLLGSVFSSAFYSMIVHVLAFKLLALKAIIFALVFLWIQDHSLFDAFAKTDNVCIQGIPIVALQACEKDFDSIQAAVGYIESQINPETDTIYNATHYNLLSSVIQEYCRKRIDADAFKLPQIMSQSIEKISDSIKKIAYIKYAYQQWRENVDTTSFDTESWFCSTKYQWYALLDISQRALFKELKKKSLLQSAPFSLTHKTSSSDSFILNSFSSKAIQSYSSTIPYTLPTYKDSYYKSLADAIKNRALLAIDRTISSLWDLNILTSEEIDNILEKLGVVFVSWCDKNTWYHKVNEYYDQKDILIRSSLEDVKLNIHLCKSYQYIDELETNIPKLIIHEIGHYMYTFKDITKTRFENICRKKQANKSYTTCNTQDFVTPYSATSSEEDYADTFSRWALLLIRESSPQHKDDPIATTSSSSNTHASAPMEYPKIYNDISTIIGKKFYYFDSLLASIKKRY